MKRITDQTNNPILWLNKPPPNGNLRVLIKLKFWLFFWMVLELDTFALLNRWFIKKCQSNVFEVPIVGEIFVFVSENGQRYSHLIAGRLPNYQNNVFVKLTEEKLFLTKLLELIDAQ